MINIGDKIPDFQSEDQNGNIVQLADFLGEKVVVYFYPKDNTPGCTKQACNIRDNYKGLVDAGFKVFGVSTDNAKSHLKFVDKFDLPFPLLVDSDKKLHNIFGVWAEKKTFGKTYMGTIRKTFVLNEKGILKKIIEKVNTSDHASQIIDQVN
jgi:peroxiredoxin Q/BCP